MSDQIITEQSDLSALTGSPGQKRKREDEGSSGQRTKRPAPTVNMAVSADTQAYIESAIEASHAVATNGMNVADFNALQQAAQNDHPEGTDPASATSTAQAALGMYPTLHVPSSTEEQFAAQAAAEGDDHANSDGSGNFGQDMPHPDGLMDGTPPVSHSPQTSSNGLPPQGHRYSVTVPGAGTPKPTVGSEEWHKMRKDNHKEGE